MASIIMQELISPYAHYRALSPRSNHGLHSHHRFSSSHSANLLKNSSFAFSTIGRGLLGRPVPSFTTRSRTRLVTTFTLDAGPSPVEGQGEVDRLGSKRLRRIIQTGSQNVVKKFNSGRKNFPMKIFLLLLGFYSANALATVLGQTGDWDVLAAGILVAVIEGIGYVKHRIPFFLGVRGANVVELANYYKSGLSFGLFVDAFKLGS